MHKAIFAILLTYCSFSYSQEHNVLDFSSFPDKLFPFEFINERSAGLIVNLRYFPALTDDPKMIVIEFYNNKFFKVKYYFTTSLYKCASYEERIKEPEFYRDFEEFTNEHCPNFAKFIRDIYQIMLPKKLSTGKYIFLDVDIYELLINTSTDFIYLDRVHLDQNSANKIKKIFDKAWKCIQKKYEAKMKK